MKREYVLQIASSERMRLMDIVRCKKWWFIWLAEKFWRRKLIIETGCLNLCAWTITLRQSNINSGITNTWNAFKERVWESECGKVRILLMANNFSTVIIFLLNRFIFKYWQLNILFQNYLGIIVAAGTIDSFQLRVTILLCVKST